MMVQINMSIPDTCSECRLSVRHFGKLYCPPLNDRVGNEGKDSKCPLVDAEGSGDMISREDALNCFHDWIDQRGDVHTADEMPEYQRIEQLPSAQPNACENTCEIERKSNDMISRADAVDAISKIKRTDNWQAAVSMALLDLPSVRPEIVHCKDCKRFVSKVWLYAGGLADIEGRCGWTGFRVMPHDYCSYAIRREDE